MTEEQMERNIKKALKIYKALRVLERNKSIDTPFFSKSMDKLIRFFTKQYPKQIEESALESEEHRNLSSVISGTSSGIFKATKDFKREVNVA